MSMMSDMSCGQQSFMAMGIAPRPWPFDPASSMTPPALPHAYTAAVVPPREEFHMDPPSLSSSPETLRSWLLNFKANSTTGYGRSPTQEAAKTAQLVSGLLNSDAVMQAFMSGPLRSMPGDTTTTPRHTHRFDDLMVLLRDGFQPEGKVGMVSRQQVTDVHRCRAVYSLIHRRQHGRSRLEWWPAFMEQRDYGVYDDGVSQGSEACGWWVVAGTPEGRVILSHKVRRHDTDPYGPCGTCIRRTGRQVHVRGVRGGAAQRAGRRRARGHRARGHGPGMGMVTYITMHCVMYTLCSAHNRLLRQMPCCMRQMQQRLLREQSSLVERSRRVMLATDVIDRQLDGKVRDPCTSSFPLTQVYCARVLYSITRNSAVMLIRNSARGACSLMKERPPLCAGSAGRRGVQPPATGPLGRAGHAAAPQPEGRDQGHLARPVVTRWAGGLRMM